MQLAGTVILYHPDAEAIKNITSWLPQVDALYVFDNTETPNPAIQQQLKALPKTIYINDAENKGIAARLNQAAHMAASNNYNWLLTMDQDSYFDAGVLDDYKNCIDNFNNKGNVAMFGVEFEHAQATQSGQCMAIQLNHLITSGSIINIAAFTTVGGFDERYFIDCVDTEYCFRAITKGFKIVKFSNIWLQHSLGKVTMHRSLLTFKLTPRTFHSPIRIYYMVRNFLQLSADYNNKFSADVAVIKKSILIRIKNIMLYSGARFKLPAYLLKAYNDFNRKRFGKYTR